MITVELIDKTVQLGGEFRDTLAFVKRQDGRRWQPESKSWYVPQRYEDFIKKCSMPVDAGDEHVTRHGSRYTTSEWETKQAMHQAEDAARTRAENAEAELEQECIAKLSEIGIPEAAVKVFKRVCWDVDEAVTRGFIKFSSSEKELQIKAIVNDFLDSVNKAYDDECESSVTEQEAYLKMRYDW